MTKIRWQIIIMTTRDWYAFVIARCEQMKLEIVNLTVGFGTGSVSCLEVI